MRRVITAIDTHSEGAAGRVLLASYPLAPGKTVVERFAYCRRHLDWLRGLMLREPRGYPGMSAILVVPASDGRADIGMIILENGGFTAMAGSSVICMVTALLETQFVPAREPVCTMVVETAAGLVDVEARISSGRVRSVTLRNVPSFVIATNAVLAVPEIGRVRVDVAYGGQFYVAASTEELGLDFAPRNARRLARAGVLVLAAARSEIPVVHPDRPHISEITWAMLTGPLDSRAMRSRSCVVAAAGPLSIDRPDTWVGTFDRSPCGTGTSARMALMYANGTLGLNEDFTHEGVLGTHYVGRLTGTTTVGHQTAVHPAITGRAWITGLSQYVLEDDDPFPEGFALGDIWGMSDAGNQVGTSGE